MDVLISSLYTQQAMALGPPNRLWVSMEDMGPYDVVTAAPGLSEGRIRWRQRGVYLVYNIHQQGHQMMS